MCTKLSASCCSCKLEGVEAENRYGHKLLNFMESVLMNLALPYFTDGLRVVLLMDQRQTLMRNIEFFNWETPGGRALRPE